MGAVVRGEDLREKPTATRNRLFDGNPLANAANIPLRELLQPAGDDGSDRATNWIADWLESRDDDRPFFLFCNFIEPHVQYDPPREYAERFSPRCQLRGSDRDQAGSPRLRLRGLRHLRPRVRPPPRPVSGGTRLRRPAGRAASNGTPRKAASGEDTLFVVCGDHGEHIGEHGFFGHQYNLYDTLLNVPLVFHGGGFTGGHRAGAADGKSSFSCSTSQPRCSRRPESTTPSSASSGRVDRSTRFGRRAPRRRLRRVMRAPQPRSIVSRPASARFRTAFGSSTDDCGRSARPSTSTSAATTASSAATASGPTRSSGPISATTSPSACERFAGGSRSALPAREDRRVGG